MRVFAGSRADKLFGVLVELGFAALGAKVVRLSFVLTLPRRRLRVNGHTAYGVFVHCVISFFCILKRNDMSAIASSGGLSSTLNGARTHTVEKSCAERNWSVAVTRSKCRH